MRNHARPRRSEKLGVDSPYLSLAEKKTHQCCCSALNKPSNGRGCHQVQESPSSWMAQGQQDTSLVWDLMASSFWVFSLIFSRVTSSVTSRKGHTGNQQVSSISLATSHLPCLSFKPHESTVSGYHLMGSPIEAEDRELPAPTPTRKSQSQKKGWVLQRSRCSTILHSPHGFYEILWADSGT